ncbi:MAG: DEAD/DEAH box helicase family protein, partial [Bacteroidaceae bacterium]|nr:DEAD/DEAH box helicase family protein [Bacteroidaceae bacterium]
ISYAQTGQSSTTNSLGMREMQAMAYEARNKRYLLIKAPPASGKSRALMFIALDKLEHQGIRKVVVAVPEKSIGRSFANTDLKKFGFFADWKVPPYFNLCDVGGNEQDKAGRFVEFFRGQNHAKVLVCAHATLRNGMKELHDDEFNDCLLAIDEFHHTSADADSGLGDIVRRVINNSTGHIVAMTGSYFRGDGVPVLRAEDEAKFYPVTYNYYQQLNGYKYLKNLVLGYHFYHGSYVEHIGEILDTRRKTIIHIPSVNSRASSGSKYEEVAEIMKRIGEVEEKDYQTCVYKVRTQDGRLLKVADLVEDDINERTRIQAYLQNMKRPDDMDIIIALGTAKEGFDWAWCEMCLTIGVRGSLTEVVQIIGRCTRDSEGKDTARFVNMIAMPDAEQADVKVAVNDFLKAITASLLMEQVMAPSWKFKTAKDDDDDDDGNPLVNTIVVEGLKPLSTEKTKMIIQQQLDDLQAAVLQDEMMVRAVSGSTTAENITQNIIPKVIMKRYPELTPEEVEEVRQHFLLNTLVKGNNITDDQGNPVDITPGMIQPREGDEQSSEGNRLIKLANKFINIDKLSINLIDTINPYQKAYEIVSKNVDAETLKIIQDTIAEQKFDMTVEEAIRLFKGPLKQWVTEHDGQLPSQDAANLQERELGQAYTIIKNLKIRRMMGLEY